MKYHILNGDALLKKVSNMTLEGYFIVLRECLVDGPAQAESLDHFWQIRTDFMEQAYQISREDYLSISMNEILKIQSIPENTYSTLYISQKKISLSS